LRKNYRKANRYYRYNKKSLFNNGFKVDSDLVINTQDYNFEKFLNESIKDFAAKELELSWKDEDPEYYKHKSSKIPFYKHINNTNIIHGDWWRIGSTKQDLMKYVTISTPHISNLDSEEMFLMELTNLIDQHYYLTFGYGRDFHIPLVFKKIKTGKFKNYSELAPPEDLKDVKDTKDLIKDYLKDNLNSEEVKFYIDLMKECNEKSISLEEPILFPKNKFDEDDEFSFSFIIPLNFDKTYIDLFKAALNNEIKRVSFNEINKFEPENSLVVSEKSKKFLSQFIPAIPTLFNTNKQIKIKNRTFKHK